MGQVQDRVVLGLPVDAVQHQLPPFGKLVEHHLARLPDRGQLRRVAEQDQRREDLAQVFELALVQHRRLIHEAHIQRLLPPLPALDEIAALQPRRRQRTGNRGNLLVERMRPVQRQIGQPRNRQTVDDGPRPGPRQPLGDLLVFRVVDRRVQNPVDRRRRHPAQPQHACRLVGRCQDRQRPPVLALLPLVVARDHLDPSRLQAPVQLRQQHGLARPGLTHHRQDRGSPLGQGRQLPLGQVDPGPDESGGQPVVSLGLVVGKDQRGGLHLATIAVARPKR